MNFQRGKIIAKWSWFSTVWVFAGYYVISRFDLIKRTFDMLAPMTLISAICMILLAKFCLSENVRLATAKAGLMLSIRECYYIYNLTQLAKYIPGSIWQFVGRIAMLRERKASPAKIRDSLLAEQAWLVVSATLLATCTLGITQPNLIRHPTSKIGIYYFEHEWFIALTVLLLAVFALLYLRKNFAKWLFRLLPSFRVLFTLLLAWGFLATSFWVTLGPFSKAPVSWLSTIGVYCLAYIAGFIIPFAPAGLGVREGVLTLGMAAYLNPEMALLMAALNRGLYILAELILIIPCTFYYKKKASPLKNKNND